LARVLIPSLLVKLTNGLREVEVPGSTLLEVIEALESRFPGVRARLTESERLRPGMAAAVDNVLLPPGLQHAVGEASEVCFLPALKGG
jgi:molybdopterin converting factor small subunit